MANLLGALGAASTVGGVVSNLLGSKKVKDGKHTSWVRDVPAHYNKYGIQRDNLGLIFCPMPRIIKSRYDYNGRDVVGITRRTEGYNIPGPSIQTTEIRRYGIGPTSRMPIGSVNTNTFSIQFVADQEGLYYKFFQAWMDGIVHFSGRSKSSINTPNAFGTNFYEVEYQDDYAVDISLIEMTQKHETCIETKLVQAFPVSIQDKQMNWGNSGFVTFNVEFAYMASDTDLAAVQKGLPQYNFKPNGPGMMGKLIKGMNTIQLLSSMKKSGGLKGVAGVIGVGATALSVFR